MMCDGGEMFPPAECLSSFGKTSTKKKNKNKRRFSDEQIRLLEVMFESESKLEPAKKLQLAKELGLQPRQVAIWFQNKRARWKSKQLQREFSILHDNYNSLASQFEALKKEKQSLLIQLQKLNGLLEKSGGERQVVATENCIGEKLLGAGQEETMKTQLEGSPSSCLPFERSEHGVGFLSDDDDSSIKANYLGPLQNEDPELEPELISNVMVVELGDNHSLTVSSDNWRSLESDGLLDDQCGSSSYQWWDVWS